MRARILLLTLLFGVACFAGGYFITVGGNNLPQGKLNIKAAPSGAKVYIDNKKASQGEQQLDIGSHTIKVAMDGFKTYIKSVNITQANGTYIAAILNPDSSTTQNWYKNHPDDQKLVEAISSQQFDSTSATILTKYPIFSRLPVEFGNGAGGLTQIASEAALNNSGKPSIGIHAFTPLQRQQALEWIYSRDYTISDLDVVFYGARIPLNTGVSE